MDKKQKQQAVASLKERFTKASLVVVTHYIGLNVAEITKLRKQGRELGVGFCVTKNSLAKLAIEGTPYQSLKDLFTGPTAIAYSHDPISAAKTIVSFAKENEKLVILGGASIDKNLTISEIQMLAKMPSLDELRAKFVALLQTPATRIAGILQEPASKLARVLSAYSKLK